MAAAKGEISQAIRELQTALSHAPQDPFLLRTAGQIVAWYDAQTDRSKLSEADREAIDWMRNIGAGKEAYADAYRTTTEARSGASTNTPQSQTIYPPANSSAPAPPQSTGGSYYYPSDSPYL